jgi:hypothetical protein
MSVRLSVRMEQLGSHWADFNYIWHFQYLYLENRVVYDIISKNMVEAGGPQKTSQHGAYALHAA